MTPEVQRFIDAVKAGKKLSPRAMGVLADTFKQIETERLKADKVAEALKVEETAIKLALIAAMRKAEINAIGGSTYATELKSEDRPTVKDWPKFYEYIKANDAFELLERRISSSATKERWEDGIAIPGVDRFQVDKLSFTKLKG